MSSRSWLQRGWTRAATALCGVGIAATSLASAPPTPPEVAGDVASPANDPASVVVGAFAVEQLADNAAPDDDPPAGTAYYAGGGRLDSQRLGPSALEVDADGSFWVADPVSRRILRIDQRGIAMEPFDLPDQVVGLDDLVVTDGPIYLLDTAAIVQVVLELDRDGAVTGTFPLPEHLTTFQGMPSIRATGLLRTLEDAILLELEGGAGHYELNTSTGEFGEVGVLESGDASVEIGVVDLPASGPPSSPSISIGGKVIAEAADQSAVFRSYRVLGFSGSGMVHLHITLARPDQANRLQLEQRIEDRRGPSGELQLLRDVSDESGYTHVENRFAVSDDGDVYELRPHPESIEIVRLGGHEAPGPENQIDASLISSVRGVGWPAARASFVDVPSQTPPAYCVGLIDAHYATRSDYIDNSWYLTSANMNGQCSGRDKPRYLVYGDANYPGVSYKWGGFDTADLFDWFAAYGSLVGDISKGATVGCAVGVDCSGYVSRVWQQSTKFGTWNLPTIASVWSWFVLEPFDLLNHSGTHAMLMSAYGPNGGLYVTESTTYNSYDRTVSRFASNAYLQAFVPYRSNALIPCLAF